MIISQNIVAFVLSPRAFEMSPPKFQFFVIFSCSFSDVNRVDSCKSKHE